MDVAIRVWLARDTLVQVDYRGALAAEVTGVDTSELDCDGAGEMLYRQGTTIFVTTGGASRPVTDGIVVATGPTTFLVRDCAATTTCALTVIDRPSGQRHALTIADIGTTARSVALPPQNRIGSISPDGQTAVAFRSDNEAVFVDLKTGIGQGVSSIAARSNRLPGQPIAATPSTSGPTTSWRPSIARPQHQVTGREQCGRPRKPARLTRRAPTADAPP